MLSEDPIIRGIYGQMKVPINLLIEQRHYLAAVILLFSTIDAMANLGRPDKKQFNDPKYFKQWVTEYLRLRDCPAPISAEDWYSARSAAVHAHSVFSKKTEHGYAQYIMFGWGDASVWQDRKNNMISVRVEDFRDAVFSGLDRFLIDLFSTADPKRRAVLEDRLKRLSVPLSIPELERRARERSDTQDDVAR